MALTHEETLTALKSLKPGASFAIKDGVIEWRDSSQTQPTANELEAEDARLKKAFTDTKYQRDRKDKYPEIGDQLDDLYKKGAFSADMAAKIKKVKDDNPKP